MKRQNKEKIEKAIGYINSEKEKLDDGYLIEHLIKTRKELEKDLSKTSAKKFRESLIVNKVNNNEKNMNVRPLTSKQKIKNKPKKHSSKVAFYGIIAGIAIGIPVGKMTYDHTRNLPSSHNYITVNEHKNGIVDRKEHDSTNYKKYIMKNYGLSEEEAEERIQREEEQGRWER